MKMLDLYFSISQDYIVAVGGGGGGGGGVVALKVCLNVIGSYLIYQ